MAEAGEQLRALAQGGAPNAAATYSQGTVEIVGPDLDASLRFYASLGFQLERRTGGFAVINGFGVRIFLAENRDAPTARRWSNIRVMVGDVNAIWNCVNANGIRAQNIVGDRDYGLRDFLVLDPSGFEVRFAQAI